MAGVDLSAFEDFSLDRLNGPVAKQGEPLRLDPKTIRASRWVNRADQSFENEAFAELKAEIADAGGNVQPIKVRPLTIPDGAIRYEVVFGHRRHRACLDLGIDVAAVVEDVDDQKLWAQMERENRSRANLSPYEQGRMYQQAIDAGLFPSLRQLAAAIGRSQGDVSNAMAIANLPREVIDAFPSPTDIQFRHAKPLKDAVASAPDAVVEVAAALAKAPEQVPPAAVFQALTEAAQGGVRPSNAPAESAPGGVKNQTVRRSNALGKVEVNSQSNGASTRPQKPAAVPACLRFIVKVGDMLMELAHDAKPRKGRIPVRPLGTDGEVQYIAPSKVMLEAAEAR